MTRMSRVTAVGWILLVVSGCEEWNASMLEAQQQQRPQQQAAQRPPQQAQPRPEGEWRPKRGTYERSTDGEADQAVTDFLAKLPTPTTPDPNEPRTFKLEPRTAEPKAMPLRMPPRDTTVAKQQTPTDVNSRRAEPVKRDDPQVAQSNMPVTLHGQPEPVAITSQPNKPKLMSVSVTPRHKNDEDVNEPAAIDETPKVAAVAASKPALIEELIAQTEAELASNPSDARLQWRLGLLRLAADKPAKAGELSQELTEQRRGLLARQVAFESALQAVLDGDADGVDRAYAALEALRDDLRSDADLALPTLALCSKVTTFGVYDELPGTALAPYRANRAIVYCEIDNLATETDPTGQFRTLLATRLELFTKDGRSRWVHEEQRIEDVSRQRRDDFFIAQLVTFPADLGPGDYVLKATVTDLLGSKTNEVSRNISIGGDTALSSAAP